jgi:hypothetical protein
MKGTDRKAHPQQVEPLLRPALEERRNVDPAKGHAKEVIDRVAKEEDRLPALEGKTPVLPGGGLKKAACLAGRHLECPLGVEVRISRVRDGAIRP